MLGSPPAGPPVSFTGVGKGVAPATAVPASEPATIKAATATLSLTRTLVLMCPSRPAAGRRLPRRPLRPNLPRRRADEAPVGHLPARPADIAAEPWECVRRLHGPPACRGRRDSLSSGSRRAPLLRGLFYALKTYFSKPTHRQR